VIPLKEVTKRVKLSENEQLQAKHQIILYQVYATQIFLFRLASPIHKEYSMRQYIGAVITERIIFA
jgi:hypothetical protein